MTRQKYVGFRHVHAFGSNSNNDDDDGDGVAAQPIHIASAILAEAEPQQFFKLYEGIRTT